MAESRCHCLPVQHTAACSPHCCLFPATLRALHAARSAHCSLLTAHCSLLLSRLGSRAVNRVLAVVPEAATTHFSSLCAAACTARSQFSQLHGSVYAPKVELHQRHSQHPAVHPAVHPAIHPAVHPAVHPANTQSTPSQHPAVDSATIGCWSPSNSTAFVSGCVRARWAGRHGSRFGGKCSCGETVVACC